MATINKSKYAILGVLCIKPCSGYDIKKFCDKTISHFWNENFGHIYPVLKQLEGEKLIVPNSKQEEDRKKLYHITEEGKQAFYEWLAQTIVPSPPRSELLLKLSFGNHMPLEKVNEMLNGVKERHQKNLTEYQVWEASYLENEAAKKDAAFPYWLASLRYGILTTQTTIRWCDETIELLKSFDNRPL